MLGHEDTRSGRCHETQAAIWTALFVLVNAASDCWILLTFNCNDASRWVLKSI